MSNWRLRGGMATVVRSMTKDAYSPPLVLQGYLSRFRTNWWLHDHVLYYYRPAATGGREILRHDLVSGRIDTLGRIDGLPGPGITVSPDGAWLLYAWSEDAETDLRVAPQFQ